MNITQRIHEKILDFLIKENKRNPNFFFATRQKNNDNRLDKGYWFQGNDGYVYVSFWEGGDWKEKIRSIGFVVLSNKTAWIELSAQDSEEKANFLKIVADKLGFTKHETKDKWFKYFDGTEYLET